MTPEKGKYVSRSTYQKVVEENRRLKKDIEILVMGDSPRRKEWETKYDVFFRWKKQFLMARDFNRALQEMLTHGKGNISPTQ